MLLLIGMHSWRAAEFAIATAGAYLAFYFAFAKIPLVGKFNRLPDVYYGVYLYGWPIQKLFLWYQPTLSPWLLFAASTVSAVMLGTLSWYAVEKPALWLEDAFFARPSVAQSI